jgi:hypothetical protein
MMDNENSALFPAPTVAPATLFSPTPKAAKRVLAFFTAQINNDHTRKAYLNATRRFAEWCAVRGISELAGVHPFHVAAFIKDLQDPFSPPTVKQHLAALCMLFDWLVTGHVLDVNPAHAVRGPKYVVKKGKTPVLTDGLHFRPRGRGAADEGEGLFCPGEAQLGAPARKERQGARSSLPPKSG